MIYNEDDWAQRVASILEKMPEIFQIEISDNNIIISENNSESAIKIYFEFLSSYIKSDNFLLQEKNLVLLKESSVNSDFTKLDTLITINDNEIAKLVDASVPSSWKEIHKKFLKTVITARNIYISIRGLESDPIKALTAINEFENIEDLWISLNQDIKNLIQLQGLNLSI